ncbi:IS5 family transposase [Thiorhodococcus mannitoliphagus]|uniref:IS5 family transposase n=1 Tax=Thiorhodococcus mannitoliphagus TaxID=329406 RepID=A0A6P1E779_9GAMM|nr:IS5 family transposase [Thiorhodococcus mannitoliphagus]NEX23844.1 IS5 family transposase [Thiorhodococcus mannitoliphagus]
MNSDNAHTPLRYPSDLSDEEWAIIEPILNELDPYKTGRPRESNLREILNAIFYLNKTGCPWRYLPKDFPPYNLVNYYYNKWTHGGVLEQINAALRARLRQKQGRNPEPSGAIIDSQSVKGTPESSIESGFDGGKLVKGRKRHIVVDTMGCLLVACVHAANVFDGKAARQVLTRLFMLLQSVKLIWADCGYVGRELFDWVLAEFDCTLEIVKRKKGKKGFHVLPRRWVVERTFAWLGRSRRLSKDYEREPRSSESQVYLASSRLLLRQICNNQIAYE